MSNKSNILLENFDEEKLLGDPQNFQQISDSIVKGC
jgi:hypothetical protein